MADGESSDKCTYSDSRMTFIPQVSSCLYMILVAYEQ